VAATGYVGSDPHLLPLAGGTMTGPIVLPGDPASPLQAVDKQYADSLVSGGVADATTTSKGKVQLAGDLAGTAAAPTVPGLAGKVGTGRQILAGTGLTGGGDLTADRTLSATDATTGGKGIVQLAGDLAGTAAAPTVPGLASKVGSVTALDGTITISGTATAPTVGVNAIPESKVTGLVADLAAKVASVTAADGTITVGGTATAPTISVGSIAESKVTGLTADLAAKAPAARLITAGTGLTGGGDLTADRTLAVSYGTGAGTAAQGNDSRITGAVQSSVATTKGDLLLATASATIARLGVGSDGWVLTADAASAGGVKWAAVSGGGGASGQDNIFPLSAYSLLAASGDPNEFQNQSGVSGNTVFMARVWIPAGTAISKLAAAVRTGGTYSASATPNQIAIYDDTGTQIGITADDSTLWATAGWAARAITTIASQGTGRFVYIGYIVGGYSGLSMPFPMGAADLNAVWLGQNINNAGNRRAFYLSASSLPASFNPASAGTNTGYIPLVGAA
jgi:hypothetical protein